LAAHAVSSAVKMLIYHVTWIYRTILQLLTDKLINLVFHISHVSVFQYIFKPMGRGHDHFKLEIILHLFELEILYGMKYI